MWWPPASACWECGELNKETVDTASTSVWEKATPPVLSLEPDNYVSPLVSLAAAPALELRMSSSVSKSVLRPFKRNVCDY